MSAKDILKVVPTIQAASLVGYNLKFAKKKKKKLGDFVEAGTTNIVGSAMTKEAADFIGGM